MAFARPADEVEEAPAIDESSQNAYAYEDRRDHALQESVNAGQSGYALPLILQGSKPWTVVQSESYSRGIRSPIDAEEPEVDIENLPPPGLKNVAEGVQVSPHSDNYQHRLQGGLFDLAKQLSGVEEDRPISRGAASYGRRKRQAVAAPGVDTVIPDPAIAAGISQPSGQVGQVGQASLGSFAESLAFAKQLAGAPERQAINRGPGGYGRRKRQTYFAVEGSAPVVPVADPAPVEKEPVLPAAASEASSLLEILDRSPVLWHLLSNSPERP